MDWSLPLIVVILFFASSIRSTFGFGEALIAVPLLAFIIPVSVAAPVAVLVSITIAVIVVWQDWRRIHFRSVAWLVSSTLIATPLGLLLLLMAPERSVKFLLAVVIIGFSSFSLVGRIRAHLKDERQAWLFGFAAGVLGGAYGMNGPPLVIYGVLRRWSPQHFRATLQGYFLPASLIAMGGYWLAGLWTSEVTHYYFVSLPAVLLAIFLGRILNQRIPGRVFLWYIHAGLVLVGILLLGQSLFQQ